MNLLFACCNLAMKSLLIVLTRWQVSGRENVPQEGAFMVVANHLHIADPPLLVASLPRRITFMAKEEIFRSPIQGPLAKAYGAFPVHRNQLARAAWRQAMQVLKGGRVLGMFPEARRSPCASLQAAFPGAALIAYESGSTILPVGIAGTERIKGWWFLKRPRIAVNVGHPFQLPRYEGRPTKEQLVALTDIIMHEIARMLPPSYRGVYAEAAGTAGTVEKEREAVEGRES